MNVNLNESVDGLLLYLKEYGLKPPSVVPYYNIYHSLANYCYGRYNVKLDDNVFKDFTQKAQEKYVDDSWCYEYYRFTNRAILLLKTYYETGKPNLEYKKGNYKYNPTANHLAHMEKIIEKNNLENDAKLEMEQVMRHFFCFIEDKNFVINNVNDQLLLDFLDEGYKTNSGTMHRITRALKLLSKYFKNSNFGTITYDYSMLTIKATTVRTIEPYTKNEVVQILKAIDTTTSIGLRDYAIFILIYETGLRGGDVINLTLKDIDWKKHLIEINQGKTNQKIIIPLNNEVSNAIADYILNGRPENDTHYLFLRSKAPYQKINYSDALCARLEKYQSIAKIKNKYFKSVHSLRRGFASELSLKGIPLQEISELLGHKSISEDRPYLTYNRKQILFCAMNFDDTPVTKGVYNDKKVQ
ncbi:MAG: site-specific integrase [Bacillota bacterium]|nr:site-specific integrase [Bacillota bacterium]